MRRSLPSLIAALALLVVAPAQADKPAEPKSKYAGIIAPLDWGAGTAQLFGKLKTDLDASYRDQMKTSDTIKIDRLMREKAAELQRRRDSVVHFNAGLKGYETSLVASEVLPGQGEALVRIDEQGTQKYYVFRNDRMWKVVVAYNTSRLGTFADFIGQVRAKYGPPKKVTFAEVDGERQMAKAIWEDEHTRMEAEDQSSFFSSYVMRYVEVGEGTRLQDARENAPRAAATAGEKRAEGLMGDIFSDDGGSTSGDVVDQITGVEAKVDLTTGRPAVYAPPPMAEDEAPAKKKKRSRGKATKKKAPPKKAAEPAIIF